MGLMPPFHHGPKWHDAGVTFRLCAPDAKTVTLLLNAEEPRRLARNAEGWYTLHVPEAKAGDRYRFCVDGKAVPDPASRFQPEGIAEPSCLMPADAFSWTDNAWQGRPWEEAVIYELHTGCFSPEGNFAGIEAKLDYLAEAGITAVELMPIAEFAGKHGWGYDGVLHYAPHNAYGTPDDLKRLIDAAHARGIMVMLDVVYNHFGPEGNYLNSYASSFFTDRYKTPWGSAVNFECSLPVRQFFIENALYWIHEFHFDGLRFDAVHEIYDDSQKHILDEIAETVRASLPPGRHMHLVLENDKNQARFLSRDAQNRPEHFTAQWNDDIHHVLHRLITDETGGYYSDYTDNPLERLGRCLTQGFDYQGEASAHRKDAPRGEDSKALPPQAFISFLQNHDQAGNRALGERLTTLTEPEKLALAQEILLLGPQSPMLFMGEEWGAQTPFLYFCDFDEELAKAVHEGRSKEFESFFQTVMAEKQASLPDPNATETFQASCLDWQEAQKELCANQLAVTRRLLQIRAQHVVPLLKQNLRSVDFEVIDGQGLRVMWRSGGGETLQLIANFSAKPLEMAVVEDGTVIWGATGDKLTPWKSLWIKGTRHA